MDTTKLEIQAENYISSQLLKFDFLVSKPQYDKEGCDLQILDDISFPTRVLKIQAKGRSISKDTNVKIPKNYVSDNFILFLYVVDTDKNETLYIFFPEEVKLFTSSGKNYTLHCQKKTFGVLYSNNCFSKPHAIKLKQLLKKSKIKEETTVIIDSISLERSIKSTALTYRSIYPTKKFLKPDLLEIVKKILICYDRNEFENKIINVYIFKTPHNNFQIPYYDFLELFINKNKIRLFEMKIDGIICFEIEDFLKRLIHSENIILVASEANFLGLLKNLKDENMEVTLVLEKRDNNLREFGFNWGDISYPIGLAMGLQRTEL
jgi:hypothetical protein